MATAELSLYKTMAGACASVGLPVDTAKRFARASYFPLPKQIYFHRAAHECDKRTPDAPTDVGLGGARGGAKSHGVLAQLSLDDCQRQDSLKCLWLRQIGVAAKEALEDLIPRVVKIPHEYVSSPIPTIRFPNRSRILVGHFKNESDIMRYLGLEYDVIATEEASQLSASKNSQIGTCLRTSKPDWKPRRYYTTNPGGIGHGWFKKKFIEPSRNQTESKTRFISSTFRDNPYLNPEYVEQLNQLTGWLRSAWRDGDWDIAAGQFFTNFRYEKHVIEPFEIPAHWEVWAALDYGFNHPTTCHLFAKNDGIIYVIGEYGERKKLVPSHAEAIKQMIQRKLGNMARLNQFVAGQDAFAQRGNESGKTIADQYKDFGIKLSPANTDRISGAGQILGLLGDAENNIEPKMFFFDTCSRIIEQLPSLQHDPNRPEDVLKVDIDEDGSGGDDYYDDLRYGVMTQEKYTPVYDETVTEQEYW